MQKMFAVLAVATLLLLVAPDARADVLSLSTDQVSFSMDTGQSTLLAYGPPSHDPRMWRHRHGPKHYPRHFRPASRHRHYGHMRPAPKHHPRHFRHGPRPRR